MKISKKYGPWAVVTGASSGIGAEFARQLAAQKINVVLVARRLPLLDALAAELKSVHGVSTRVVQLDLTEPGYAQKLQNATADLDVGLLVNNAGFASPGKFLDRELDDELFVVDLNIKALLSLAHQFGRRFRSQNRGGIVLVASTLGFGGTPFLANYAATKAYVLSLGEALSYELRHSGVDVLTLAPGATDTALVSDFDMESMPFNAMPVEPVVERALTQLGRASITIPGVINNLMATMVKFLPRRTNVNMFGGMMDSSANKAPTRAADAKAVA